MNYKNKKNKDHCAKPLLYAVVIIVAAIGIGIYLKLNNNSTTKITLATASTAGPNTKGNVTPLPSLVSHPLSSSTSNSVVASNSGGSSKNDSTNPNVNTSLLTPVGDFVSYHTPSMSGANGQPSQIQSVCNTTPGATCQIIFTQNGVTKLLPTQTADSGGATYWTWNVADPNIGLTPGNWQIQAVATLDTQSATATDATLLRISP